MDKNMIHEKVRCHNYCDNGPQNFEDRAEIYQLE